MQYGFGIYSLVVQHEQQVVCPNCTSLLEGELCLALWTGDLFLPLETTREGLLWRALDDDELTLSQHQLRR